MHARCRRAGQRQWNMSAFTESQVREHSSANDLWVVNKGKVYDISDFVDRHPGGRAVLAEHAGQDVTDLMSSGGKHSHSSAAYRILDKYYIGEIRRSKSQDKSNGTTEDQQLQSKTESNGHGVTESIHNWKDDDLIDWSKPVLPQVGQLGENYLKWVHSPVDKRIRFFHSDFVENLSVAHWYVVPVFWIPVMILFLTVSYRSFPIGGFELWLSWIGGGVAVRAGHMPVLFLAGMLMWTLAEYAIHRWLFHLTPPPNSPFLIRMHFLLHGQHHKAPFDERRLVFPIVPASMFGMLFILLYRILFPLAMSHSVMAGTVMGYVCYDLMHYYLHHGTPFLSYFKQLKRYHIRHHFEDQQRGFGISTKLWDYPFGTLIPEVEDKTE